MLDTVPAMKLTVNATPADNAISYTGGALPAQGKVTVGGNDDLLSRTLIARDVNWIAIDGLQEELKRRAVDTGVAPPPSAVQSETKTGLRVHGKTGQSCPVCGDTIREVSFADSSLQYCPTCQTGGKPLADRRLSRLLKLLKRGTGCSASTSASNRWYPKRSKSRGFSSAGRASALQAEGQGFESPKLHRRSEAGSGHRTGL